MSFITVTQKGSFDRSKRYLRDLNSSKLSKILNKYGAMGVTALANATPIDTSLTSNSWSFDIIERPGYCSIRWFNSNRQNGSNVAILLQYGHATRNGGYVQGHDYIMPAIRPVFDLIAAEVQKEVTK